MEMIIPHVEYQKRIDNCWVTQFASEDKAHLYEQLSNALVSKKINCCSYIKSIKREQHYDYVKITVTQDNGHRAVYYLNATSF